MLSSATEHGNRNFAAGSGALVNATGSSNIALGFGAGQNLTTGSNDIDLANDGKAGESKVMRFGTKGDQTRTYVAGISGRTVSGTGQTVVVNAQGQLGTASAGKLGSASERQLRAHVRLQDREIATLKRELAELSAR